MLRSNWTRWMVCLSWMVVGAIAPVASGSPVGGTRYDVKRVDAYSSDVFYVAFRAGEHGAVYVKGDGDTDLDLFVYDEYGNLIGSDTDFGDTCMVMLNPRWTGTFRIVVENHGSVYNQYEIEAR